VEAVPSGTLQFHVTKSKINWRTYFMDTMRPKFGGGFEDYSGKGPSVVAENSKGETRVLAVCTKPKEAEATAATMEGDFRTLGPAAWCERYGVPPDFVS
jgi:hypothetical protein